MTTHAMTHPLAFCLRGCAYARRPLISRVYRPVRGKTGNYLAGYGSCVSGKETGLRELGDGSLEGPNGVVYRRTPVRIKRRSGSELVDAGTPVVTSVYPEGLTWYEGGAEATAAWAEIKPRLVEGKPPQLRDLQWVGHLWQADEGAELLRFEGQH